MELFSRKEVIHIEFLLRFPHNEPVTDAQKREYLDYQSKGGTIAKDNPLLDCQRWKEWVITQMIEEAFEFWCFNRGWAIPLILEIERTNNKINYVSLTKTWILQIATDNEADARWCKAIHRIMHAIEMKGMLQFYLAHDATNKDEKRLLKMLKMKFGQDFEFKKG